MREWIYMERKRESERERMSEKRRKIYAKRER